MEWFPRVRREERERRVERERECLRERETDSYLEAMRMAVSVDSLGPTCCWSSCAAVVVEEAELLPCAVWADLDMAVRAAVDGAAERPVATLEELADSA